MSEHGSRAPAGRSAAGAAVALALAVGACADAPTRPPSEPAASAAVSSAASPAALAPGAAAGLLADASGRLLPSLADARARLQLRGYLDALAESLDAGDDAVARRQLGLARKLIAGRLESAEGADLAALALTLDQVEAELDQAAAAPAARP